MGAPGGADFGGRLALPARRHELCVAPKRNDLVEGRAWAAAPVEADREDGLDAARVVQGRGRERHAVPSELARRGDPDVPGVGSGEGVDRDVGVRQLVRRDEAGIRGVGAQIGEAQASGRLLVGHEGP